MAGNGETNLDDPVDPEVRVFVERVNAGFVRQGPFDGLPFPEARRVAEQVRSPWRQGGPQMADTREILVPTGGEGVRIRIYDPGRSGESTPPLRPALVYMHGGGWTLFSLDTHDRLMREYAARSGLIVIGVDYALSPEAKFPTALEQVTAVVRWLREHGATLGVDAARIALGGDSAGGNLAMTASLKLRDDEDEVTIAGILVNYGAFAPECSDDATRRYGGDGYMLGT
jgi:acetyl esterase